MTKGMNLAQWNTGLHKVSIILLYLNATSLSMLTAIILLLRMSPISGLKLLKKQVWVL